MSPKRSRFWAAQVYLRRAGSRTFESKNGLYRKKDKRFFRYSPEYFLSSDSLIRRPEVFFDYFRKNLDCRRVEPNAAHRVLAWPEIHYC